jgi:hypothetical protein
MSLRIKICREVGGSWSVDGLSPVPVSDFPSLTASLDYAREACDAAPAAIELYVDGMYIVAHQERGWPKSLVNSRIRADFNQIVPVIARRALRFAALAMTVGVGGAAWSESALAGAARHVDDLIWAKPRYGAE